MNASSEEPEHRLKRQLDAVHSITSGLYAATTWGEKEEQVRRIAMEVVGADGGTVYLHNAARKTLVFHHVEASEGIVAQLRGREMSDREGIAGAVFQSGQSLVTTDSLSTRSMLTVPMKTMRGRVLGVLQVIGPRFDLADLEVLEIIATHAAAIFEMARLYEEANRAAVVNLIGDISHDVKNFLTPVVTGSQTLEIEIEEALGALDRVCGQMDAEQRLAVERAVRGLRGFYREVLGMLYEGAHGVQERVREIADAVKGVVSLPHFELTRFPPCAEAVARMLKPEVERRGVALDLSGVADPGPVELDAKRIYNALYNLVNNSLPETPSGGTISIRSRQIVQEQQPWLEIQVADTGRGMPEAVRARLFTDDAVSTNPGGTGLGTRIVKNVVDTHRGTIQVESDLGLGTTFTLRLPMRQPPRD